MAHPVRDPAALRRHYDVERELADRLRCAAPADRPGLYRTVYNELFSRVPDHPQLTRKQDAAQQQATTERQLRLLRPRLGRQTVYMEVGAGDCHLAMTVARLVQHVYAVDVSRTIAAASNGLANFTFVLSDGIGIDVPAESVHVAYSHQLLEHLHPDDAAQQLRQIVAALAPGGVYICITPHRYSGPHDISKHFDSQATGFHMKEYTYSELRSLFRTAGFASTQVWTGVKGHFLRVPEPCVRIGEGLLDPLPHWLRKRLARSIALRPLLDSITVVGQKPFTKR
jgi:SAM-dependent methyltransferase